MRRTTRSGTASRDRADDPGPRRGVQQTERPNVLPGTVVTDTPEILADLGQRTYSGETEISLGLQALAHAQLANAAVTATGSSAEWMKAAGTRLSDST
jgi:hypothetical protein